MSQTVPQSRTGRPPTGYIYRRGRTWWFSTQAGGRRRRVSLHTTDRGEAERKRRALAAAALVRVELGDLLVNMLGMPARPATALYMARAADAVLDEARAAGTSAAFCQTLRARWAALVDDAAARGVARLDRLTAATARAILTSDLAGLAAKTRRQYAALLRRVAKARGLPDPAAGILIRGEKAHRRALTDDETARLISTAEGETRTLILMALHTGARLGDLCRLQWQDIDGDAIRFTPTKTARSSGRGVVIPMHPDVAAAIGPRQPSGPILPGMAARYAKGRYQPSRDVQRVFRAASIVTTGPEGGAHYLRHTFVSRLVRVGVPEAVVMALAGHTNAATSRGYQHIDEATVRAALRVLPGGAGQPGKPIFKPFAGLDDLFKGT